MGLRVGAVVARVEVVTAAVEMGVVVTAAVSKGVVVTAAVAMEVVVMAAVVMAAVAMEVEKAAGCRSIRRRCFLLQTSLQITYAEIRRPHPARKSHNYSLPHIAQAASVLS